MSVIGHNGPWHIFVCPGCGRNVHGPRHRCDVPDPGLSERVEVVRADQLTGAVSERDFWRRRAVDLGAKVDEYEAGSAVVRDYVEARDQLRGQRG